MIPSVLPQQVQHGARYRGAGVLRAEVVRGLTARIARAPQPPVEPPVPPGRQMEPSPEASTAHKRGAGHWRGAIRLAAGRRAGYLSGCASWTERCDEAARAIGAV